MAMYVDTNILIYLLEQHDEYRLRVAEILEAYIGLSNTLVTSVITITEFLAGTTGASFKTLQKLPRLSFLPVTETIAERAAVLKQKHTLSIGDALHLATALHAEAEALFTNDKQLATVAQSYLKVKRI